MSDSDNKPVPSLRQRLAAIAGGTEFNGGAMFDHGSAYATPPARVDLPADSMRAMSAMSTPQPDLVRRREIGTGYLVERDDPQAAAAPDGTLMLFA